MGCSIVRTYDTVVRMETQPLAPFVAAEIRAEMARQNLTSAALALRVGRPKQTVHRWTAGQTPVAVDDLPAVCEALGITLVELFTSAVVRRDREHVVTGAQTRRASLLAS
jgi:transcriptional regulator with XRE-family HTH domain